MAFLLLSWTLHASEKGSALKEKHLGEQMSEGRQNNLKVVCLESVSYHII